jgi:hypothetical protein
MANPTIEERIERAERRARTARSCADQRLDEALGDDRRFTQADVEGAEENRRMAARHTSSEETYLRAAQALRNELRERAWRVRLAGLEGVSQ